MVARSNDALLSRELMEQLMFGAGRVRRFTQDSPVLPDVWLEYTKATRLTSEVASSDPFPPVKLLLTPQRDVQSGKVAQVLRERLTGRKRRIVYNQTAVGAELSFEELVREVLPMTKWWADVTKNWKLEDLQTNKKTLAGAMKNPEHPAMEPDPKDPKKVRRLPPDLLWMIRVVGAIAVARSKDKTLPEPLLKENVIAATEKDWLVLVEAIADLVKDVKAAPDDARIFVVSLNREASPTVSRSTLAIKADAARRVFNISCKDIRWAIIDSGIDAEHPAFRLRDLRDKDEKLVSDEAFTVDANGQPVDHTRIVETYDFTQIDLLLDPSDIKEQPAMVKAALEGPRGAELQGKLEELTRSLQSGRAIDWSLIAPLLRIPHEKGKYIAPEHDHGTHVAGILAGDWRKDESQGLLEENLIGVCPDLRLYDLRVLNKDGRGDEFAVMAALQFIRYLNSTNDYMVVHGANMSLSIPHEVSNYACGRTPVCEECERVVSNGVVVVAAAGNQGYRKYTTVEGLTAEAYNSISITDPGNADMIITVGATHRYRPHTYGVSYFSSRGPTGDGRNKPDLVAPGEKISAPLPRKTFGLKDGTSMASPHVSGAAALLMARHDELLGQPGRIKQILCSTATDLGRERYFQGAGMLDVLRAIQSV